MINTAPSGGLMISGNTGIGHSTGTNNATGDSNTWVGYSCGTGSGGNSNASNSGVGRDCLGVITTGGFNSAIGSASGDNITTGSYNVTLGYASRPSAAGASYQYTIGVGNIGIADNNVAIGKLSNVIYADFSSSAAWTRTSDERLKTNIQNDNLGLNFICKLRPVSYQWKPSYDVPQELTRNYNVENQMNTDIVMNGFIAQEVKQALDESGALHQGMWSTQDDGTQAISREMFIMPMINAIKQLKAEFDAYKATHP
jgi:hypothetical protein